jgi:Zn-dependent protease/CBS domain-containing protein
MYGKGVQLFKLFGFAVRVDVSWIVIALLVTWSLARGFFPERYETLDPATYWRMGMAGALGLFISIVIHELFHALMARRYGLPMKGITLFIFGGVAEMTDEPPSARAEFMIAIVGPLASVAIALLCFGLYSVGNTAGLPEAVTGVLRYLWIINMTLVIFNMIPAFPLDGGRVLRSLLWEWKNDIGWATRISASIGSGFGLLLIALGIMSLFSGRYIGGTWWLLIGMFLRNAATMSYQQVVVQRALKGETVSRFMKTDAVAVAPETSIADLVEDYIYKYHFKMLPVVDNGKLIGRITTRQVREISREEWDHRTVGEIMESRSEENTIHIGTDAATALSRMSQSETSRLMVADGNRLVGILSLKDMLNFLSLKMELEDDDYGRPAQHGESPGKTASP